MAKRVLLLSIRPKYANKIFEGTKSVELRRVRPNIQSGDLIMVYVSSPVKSLQGILEVDYVIEGELDKLWEQVHAYAGVTRDEFDDYYKNTPTGFGIFLKSVKKMSNPIGLDKLREKFGNFHPPQSYRYMLPNEVTLYDPV